MSNKQTDKCARKRDHDWETVRETKDVIIKRCGYCKGHKWVPRKD